VTTGNDRTAAAASATSFAGRAALVVPFVVATSGLAYAGAPLCGAAAPVLVLVHRFLKPEKDESFAERTFKLFVLATVWAYWNAILAGAALRAVARTPFLTAWHALAIYVPLLLIAFKRDRNAPYDLWKRVVLRLMFDFPLIATAGLLRYGAGLRLFTPFASIIDDEIVQGTLPFAADVAEMAAPPYDVCAVVNMCAEWPGPVRAYSERGIAQCRLPFQDTTAPDEAALREGAAFIAEQLEKNPGKRVYVHCKGGIARASTMSLAHYVLNRHEDPTEAVEKLKAKRSVVLRTAAGYKSVRAISRDLDGA